MIGGAMLGHLIDTAHRLATSRKFLMTLFTVVPAGITEALQLITQWFSLFGIDAVRQAKFETTCHLVAATLVLVGQWFNKLLADEDVALKTQLPPPAPTATATATVTETTKAPDPAPLVDASGAPVVK